MFSNVKLNTPIEFRDKNAPSTSIKASTILFYNESPIFHKPQLQSSSNTISSLSDTLKSIGKCSKLNSEKKSYSNYFGGRKNEVVLRRNLSELIEKARQNGLVFTIPQVSQLSSLQLAMTIRKHRKDLKTNKRMSKELSNFIYQEENEELNSSKNNTTQDPIRVDDTLDHDERLSDDDGATELSTDEETSKKTVITDDNDDAYFFQRRASLLAMEAKSVFRMRIINEEIAKKQMELKQIQEISYQNDEPTFTSARCRPFVGDKFHPSRRLFHKSTVARIFDSANIVCKPSDYANVDDSIPTDFFCRDVIPAERRMQKYMRKITSIPNEILDRRNKEASIILKKKKIVPDLIENKRNKKKKHHALKKKRQKKLAYKIGEESSSEELEELSSSSDDRTKQPKLSIRILKDLGYRKFLSARRQSSMTPEPMFSTSPQVEPNLFGNTVARLPQNVEYEEVPVPMYQQVDLFASTELNDESTPYPSSNLINEIELVHCISEERERLYNRGKKTKHLKSTITQNRRGRRKRPRPVTEASSLGEDDQPKFTYENFKELEMSPSEGEEEEDY